MCYPPAKIKYYNVVGEINHYTSDTEEIILEDLQEIMKSALWNFKSISNKYFIGAGI